MFSPLQVSKGTEMCITSVSNCTNNYDVQIVRTICQYTLWITVTIAITYSITYFIKLIINYYKNKSLNNSESKENVLTAEQEENMRFIDFCYDMTKTSKTEVKGLQEECWEILKDKYASSVFNKSAQNNEE